MNSVITAGFRDLLGHLPDSVRQQASRAYALWRTDPHHPSLQFKRVSQRQPIYSARVGLGYRVLGLWEGDTVSRRRSRPIDTEDRQTKSCDECGSGHLAAASRMSHLCPECSHWLYGYPRCAQEFAERGCSKCGWDGSVSAYIRGLQAQQRTRRHI